MQCRFSLQAKIGSGLEDIKCSSTFNGNNLRCNCIYNTYNIIL